MPYAKLYEVYEIFGAIIQNNLLQTVLAVAASLFCQCSNTGSLLPLKAGAGWWVLMILIAIGWDAHHRRTPLPSARLPGLGLFFAESEGRERAFGILASA
jgi:hypothetical protein